MLNADPLERLPRPGTIEAEHAVHQRHVRDHAFWSAVGASFPVRKGAASTRYYFECERTLFEGFFGALDGRVLLKTDLWNEAKNTDILTWAATQASRRRGFCHTRAPTLAPLTAVLVRPFAWLYRRFPAVRRNGYLIACVAEKPALRRARRELATSGRKRAPR